MAETNSWRKWQRREPEEAREIFHVALLLADAQKRSGVRKEIHPILAYKKSGLEAVFILHWEIR